ncbi:MAG: hypothetical protein IKO27_07755 [Ruminococcus sp.]|nr:hypothetical protein [Ruminococcus sp.]
MSRLTEIMKQIPLDELTGDADMKETENRNNIVSTQGAALKRRVGIIGTAAACAALVGGGIFAYTRISGSGKVDPKAPDIVSTASGTQSTPDSTPDVRQESEAYRQNMKAYLDHFADINVEYDLVKDSLYPLETESPTVKSADTNGNEGKVGIRMIGYRSSGSYIMVDLAVSSEAEKYGLFSSGDAVITLPDGGVLTGSPVFYDSQTSKMISFIFKPDQREAETYKLMNAKAGDKLSFRAENIVFETGDGSEGESGSIPQETVENYSAEFVYAPAEGFSHSVAVDTEIEVTPFDPAASRTEKITVKKVEYSNTGAEITFSFNNATDEYLGRVESALCEPVALFSGTSRFNKEDFVTFVEDSGYQRYALKVKENNTGSVTYTRLENGDFVVKRAFFNDPLRADNIDRFLLGINQSTFMVKDGISEPEESKPEDSKPEDSKPEESEPQKMLSFDDLTIGLDGARMEYAMNEDGTGTDTSKIEALVYINLLNFPMDKKLDLDKSVTATLPDGREVKLTNGNTFEFGTEPENNICYSITYTGAIPVTDLGLKEGEIIRITVKDLYDTDGNKVAEGTYEDSFELGSIEDNGSDESAPDESKSDGSAADESEPAESSESEFTDEQLEQLSWKARNFYLMQKAAYCGYYDENGEEKQIIPQEPDALEFANGEIQFGFNGLKMNLMGTAAAEGRYFAPVIDITCDDRDGKFLSKETDDALSTENDFVLITSDGRKVKTLGQGWMAWGRNHMLLSVTFDTEGSGLKAGDTATLKLSRLTKSNGSVIATGDFTAEIKF